jgi:hypothetical protein
MFLITPSRTTARRTAFTAALALTLTAAFAVPSGALAAAPTLGAPTIIPAGQPAPIDVGGNHLHQHDIIRKGTELVRWPVAMHGASSAPITLTCPDGEFHSGLGLQEGSDVAFGVAKGSKYFARTIDVRFYTIRDADPNSATGHVYALCRDPEVAPAAPLLGFPVIRKAGQRSPVDIAGNHLHRGDTIRKGTQLVRWSVTLLGRSSAYLRLDCPTGRMRGLGEQEGAKVSATLSKYSSYGHRFVKVRFSPRPGASAAGTTGSVYALCG